MPQPTTDTPSGRRLRLLAAAAVLAAAAALTLGLVVAPPDAVQGQPQRLMYVHVPAAWTAFASFTVVLVASVAYLLRRRPVWDAAAQAAAELGTGMTALAIALGSIWGRSVWGVWWAWDARLVTTAVLLLIYLGYLGVRGLSDDPDTNARRAAVIGIAGFVQVPIVHFSVLWWRTLHQEPTILAPDTSPPIDGRMAAALGAGFLAFTLAGAWFFLHRLAQLRIARVEPAAPVPVGPIVVERSES
ncbi:cytochrome c biogenesis protein CcsA [Pseudonocardia sp. MH-G8]|uniref:cytochrome c biogenesis protein CcsA n=1 Tax=Pseudonocardia sp. MH-G8 TaxID=1854588 RepID=UPI000BA0B93B|nr:cytochrome c biogenesis protein CcsA [Pseudonocardia sp. MH-G8]OZM77203.1 cytochrome C biogenesis protein [Pseudonocardia sp. MH-G8]